MHYPDFATFSQLARGVHLVPVYRRLIGDALTPVSAFHKLDAGSSACLFESVVGGEKVGRYSFLTAEPFQEIEARGNHVTFRRGGKTEEFDSPDPIEELRRRVDALRAVRLPDLPPFVSGAIGYAGYDVVRYTERLPNAPPDDRHPARSFVRLLRPHGGLRQCEQNDRGHCDGSRRPRRLASRLRRCLRRASTS